MRIGAPRETGEHETRVAATDEASRTAFTRYWRVIRHGSTAVRWELLTAVELRATA